MTYPVWSGINAEAIDSTEINGCSPTPTIQVDGFSSAVFPVLMGTYPGLFFEVVRARWEQRGFRTISETRGFTLIEEPKNISVLPETKTVGVERSRKRYP